MTPDRRHILGPHIPRLQAIFAKLQEIEGNPDIDWVELLEAREEADPLSDDSWMRGYIVGMLDAHGISIAEAVPMLRSAPNPPEKVTNFRGRRNA
ncbi:MAG: hypothetical protein HYZ29_00930 [Myxococcales bacterium]|nr:hypothetical protein [Myxococcales bacterium]